MKHLMKIIRISATVPVSDYCLTIGPQGRIVCPELIIISATTYKCNKGFKPEGNARIVKKDANCVKL